MIISRFFCCEFCRQTDRSKAGNIRQQFLLDQRTDNGKLSMLRKLLLYQYQLLLICFLAANRYTFSGLHLSDLLRSRLPVTWATHWLWSVAGNAGTTYDVGMVRFAMKITSHPSLSTFGHSSDVDGRTSLFPTGIQEWCAGRPSSLPTGPTPLGYECAAEVMSL